MSKKTKLKHPQPKLAPLAYNPAAIGISTSNGSSPENQFRFLEEENRRLSDELKKYREEPERAKREADEILQQARREADEILQQARREADELINSTLSDEEQSRLQYLKEQEAAFEERRKQASDEAERLVAQAEQDAAEILAGSRQEAEQITREAEARLGEVKARQEEFTLNIEEEIQKRREQLEADFSARKESLEDEWRQKSLDVEAGLADLKKRRVDIEIREEELEFAKTTTSDFQQSLRSRWEQCAPEKVWMLEQDLIASNRKLEKLSETAAYWQQKAEEFQALELVAEGRSIPALLSEMESNKRRIGEMSDRLANYPSEDELARLRQEASEARALRQETFSLQRQLTLAEERTMRIDLGQRELQQAKTQADALRTLNDVLREELRQNADVLEQRAGQCFPELQRLDTAKPSTQNRLLPKLESNRNLLKDLVKHVREFAATRKPALYYTESDLRAFIAGLASSRLLILQGLSGTGKTSLPRVFAEALGGGQKRISVQSNWRDRHELLGYYNDFNKRFTESEFTQAVYRASLPAEDGVPWFIVLDEMNLARCEYYFADFLSLLETPDPKKWLVELMSFSPSAGGSEGPKHLLEGRYLKVPENLWFVGTANRDESTFEITDKVYDRAQVIEFRKRQAPFPSAIKAEARRITCGDLQEAFHKAAANPKNQIQAEDLEYLYRLDEFTEEYFDITFGNRIDTQFTTFVSVYVASGGTKAEAFDYQIARKILRKLENEHGSHRKQELVELETRLGQTPDNWQPLRMSLETVSRKKRDWER